MPAWSNKRNHSIYHNEQKSLTGLIHFLSVKCLLREGNVLQINITGPIKTSPTGTALQQNFDECIDMMTEVCHKNQAQKS